MIIAELKPINDIREMVSGFKKILVLGCGGCTSVCHAGGEREARTLAGILGTVLEGAEIDCVTIPRQCEWEFIDEVADRIAMAGIVVSTACGVGVQAVNERCPGTVTVPALNTSFLGMPVRTGVFEERCLACGNCLLHLTGGICPVTRCAKNLLNGPCGGSQDGKCEIGGGRDCAWQLIYDRLACMGHMELLKTVQPPRDWTTARDGGPRRLSREDLMTDDKE